MSSPIKFKLVKTLYAYNYSRGIYFEEPLPDASYSISAEFPYNTGGWSVSGKTKGGFTLNVGNYQYYDVPVPVYIYWDGLNYTGDGTP